MKRLIVLTLAFLATPAVANAWQADQKTRTWTDLSGEHTVTAKLVEYDVDSKKVVLEKADGEWLEVEYDQLVISDRNFLSRHAARQRRAKRSNGNAEEILDPFADVSNSDKSRPGKRGDRDIQRLYAIDWHQTPDSAQSAATGGKQVSDDKPIIWFRVLGDLSGLM